MEKSFEKAMRAGVDYQDKLNKINKETAEREKDLEKGIRGRILPERMSESR